jgi:uncharacterized protein with von Willebrand factor type A (vWA) domain
MDMAKRHPIPAQISPAIKSVKSSRKDLGIPTQNTIDADSFDHLIYTGIRDNSVKIHGLAQESETTDSLVSDVFLSLYKNAPTFKEGAVGAAKKLVETMHNLPEFKGLREMTRLDDIASALGTAKLAPNMVEQIKAIQEKMTQQKQNARDLAGKNPGEPVDPADPADFDGELGDEVRQIIRAGVMEAQDKAEEWSDIVTSWGIDKGELQRLDSKHKMELANKLVGDKRFRDIAAIAGRFRNLALSAAATTPSHGMDEIVDVTQGQDLTNLLPSELSKLKKTPGLFMKDFLERKLLVYNLKGVENLGHGPIIVCLDISASMSGERETWAKAVILGLMFLAQKQKRSFGVLTFDVRTIFKKFYPRTNPPTLQQKIEIASINSDGGGTNFYAPLKDAFAMRATEMQQLNPADIVFITDGECALSDSELKEIQDLKAATNVRILGIGISDASFHDQCDANSLLSFSDNTVSVNALGDIQAVKGIFTKSADLTARKVK